MFGVLGCQKDDDSFIKQEHTPQTLKTKYSITKINYQTVQQNNLLVNSITKIKKQTETKGSSPQNRLVHSSAYDFYIDTDVATYMENTNGSYHSYTFPVIRDNPTVALENILFSLQADGTYKVSLVSYNLSESEKEALFNEQFVDLTNKIAKEDIDEVNLMDDVFNKEIQTTFTTSYVCACNVPDHVGGVNPDSGNFCDCVGIQISITNGTEENTEGNGPEEFPNNNEIPDGENNSGGGVPTDPNNPKPKEDATSPTVSIPFDQQVANCLSEYAFNGNTSIQTWLNSASSSEIKALANYLGKGDNCSNPATLDFVVAGIEAMNEGGYFDHANNVILDSTFLANEKLNCVYNKLKADNSSLFRETVGAFIDNRNANLIFTVGECVMTDLACTDDNYFAETGIIKIIIEDINTNSIDIAKMILHESIHAELTKYVVEYESGIDINNRSLLFEKYKHYKDLYGDGHIEHIYMTNKYINPIASALRVYDNNSYPIDYYKAFAWDGIRRWDADNLLSMEMDLIYESYRPIIVENSEVCN
ncbi:hypothetical protein [Xanthomarina sp. F2636L]|uniref:hypothetical protein n=1 Tax=Xanthomarina sp. F2636L TaxID=2996018 RepID=UPI00225DDF78|nr:hypothetical protein [Xanthomarina sp. F2636L]MCX7551371.1 hypothetical protein [Xanthomarina sp. F2636L]